MPFTKMLHDDVYHIDIAVRVMSPKVTASSAGHQLITSSCLRQLFCVSLKSGLLWSGVT